MNLYAMPGQRKLLWKYARGILRCSVQRQSRCTRFRIFCVIPERPNFNGFSGVASPKTMISLGVPATTWSYCGHFGDLYKGPFETQSNSNKDWHYKEVVGNEEGEGSTTVMICEDSENPAQSPSGRMQPAPIIYIFCLLHNL